MGFSVRDRDRDFRPEISRVRDRDWPICKKNIYIYIFFIASIDRSFKLRWRKYNVVEMTRRQKKNLLKKKKNYFFLFLLYPESGSGLALKSDRDPDPDRSGFSGYRNITTSLLYISFPCKIIVNLDLNHHLRIEQRVEVLIFLLKLCYAKLSVGTVYDSPPWLVKPPP